MPCDHDLKKVTETMMVQERLSRNPLVSAIGTVLHRVIDYKERVRIFYFEVLLSAYQCPQCSGPITMTGQSECSCSCGHTFDPTCTFQKSTCCGAKLIRKTSHYACSRCHKIMPSRFLFDERVFDKAYFQEMMQESRKRALKKKEEMQKLLAESRSDVLPLMEEPLLEMIPGLIQDLDDFVRWGADDGFLMPFDLKESFNMDEYRRHLLSVLGWDAIPFSHITPLSEDDHRDRVGRFITLIYMENDHEVDLVQHGDRDLLIRKRHDEAYC